MSVDRVETDLRANTFRPVTVVLHSPAKRGVSAEKNAHKLRAEGLSYRRIAIELRVRYDQVSSWLSGVTLSVPASETAASPRRWASPEKPAGTVSQPPDHTATEAVLTCRINDLMATLRQVSRENCEREERLRCVIEVEHTAAREQAARRDAELDALRAIVDELRVRVSRMDTEAAPAWSRVWRRGATR